MPEYFYELPLFIHQGGSPSPFDRIQATRQATRAVNWLTEKIGQNITDEGNRAVDIFSHCTIKTAEKVQKLKSPNQNVLFPVPKYWAGKI